MEPSIPIPSESHARLAEIEAGNLTIWLVATASLARGDGRFKQHLSSW